jgi:NTP pyrophosphatase (non-canonical NTP hydrolase)
MTDFDTYQRMAIRTASPRDPLTHTALGLTGEAGEYADAVKKHLIYGKPLDTENLKEELGDILWYVALAAQILGTTMSDLAAANIAKLKLRYPEKYTDEQAALRLDKAGV